VVFVIVFIEELAVLGVVGDAAVAGVGGFEVVGATCALLEGKGGDVEAGFT